MDAARIIRIARERSGLSKRELARLAGTSPAAIVKYESGTTSPTVDTLNRIVEVAGWAIELRLSPVVDDLVERGHMMADLLSIVDMVQIRPASEHIEFPRMPNVVS